MNNTFRRDSALALTWALLLSAVPSDLIRADSDPWAITLLDTALRPIAGHPPPSGPVIYAVIGTGRYRYVGQTVDLRSRLAGHATDRRNLDAARRKHATWEGLLVLPLSGNATSDDLNRVEALAGAVLRPDRHGGGASRYPRG